MAGLSYSNRGDHRVLRRGTFHSVADLEVAIASYIGGWNERAYPFTWTRGADEIIAHAMPSPHQKMTSNTRHLRRQDHHQAAATNLAEAPCSLAAQPSTMLVTSSGRLWVTTSSELAEDQL